MSNSRLDIRVKNFNIYLLIYFKIFFLTVFLNWHARVVFTATSLTCLQLSPFLIFCFFFDRLRFDNSVPASRDTIMWVFERFGDCTIQIMSPSSFLFCFHFFENFLLWFLFFFFPVVLLILGSMCQKIRMRGIWHWTTNLFVYSRGFLLC